MMKSNTGSTPANNTVEISTTWSYEMKKLILISAAALFFVLTAVNPLTAWSQTETKQSMQVLQVVKPDQSKLITVKVSLASPLALVLTPSNSQRS